MTYKKDIPVGAEALETWKGLNVVLKTADEGLCRALLITEKHHRKRPSFMVRIHHRLNRVRAVTERVKLKGE